MTAAETLAALARDLAAPPIRVDALGLIDLWQVDRVLCLCPRPPLLEDHPDLSLRVRGAFGRQLAALPPPIDRRGRAGIRAFDLLFGSLAKRTAGTELPKPCLIRAWVEGERLLVELSLFGIAGIVLDQAATALAAALDGGIALRSDRALRVRIPVDDILVRRDLPAPAAGPATTASLRFRTPVIVREKTRGGPDGEDAARAILRAIPRRVASMARFQYCAIDEDWPALALAIEQVAIDDRDLLPYGWTRHSRRMGARPIPMAGHLGTLRLTSPCPRLAPYLRLAESCNAGSHASLGTGWFDLALYG